MTGANEEEFSSRWSMAKERVLCYAATEERKIIKSLLASYNSVEGNSGTLCTACVYRINHNLGSDLIHILL